MSNILFTLIFGGTITMMGALAALIMIKLLGIEMENMDKEDQE